MTPPLHMDPSLADTDPEAGRLAGCLGKEPFARPQLAWKVARRRRYVGVQVYRCDHCGLFHFGRAPASGLKHTRKGGR